MNKLDVHSIVAYLVSIRDVVEDTNRKVNILYKGTVTRKQLLLNIAANAKRSNLNQRTKKISDSLHDKSSGLNNVPRSPSVRRSARAKPKTRDEGFVYF